MIRYPYATPSELALLYARLESPRERRMSRALIALAALDCGRYPSVVTAKGVERALRQHGFRVPRRTLRRQPHQTPRILHAPGPDAAAVTVLLPHEPDAPAQLVEAVAALGGAIGVGAVEAIALMIDASARRRLVPARRRVKVRS